MKKHLLLVLSVFLLVKPLKVWAIEAPNFPACSNPGGVVVVSYENGIHGIVGNPGQFSGADKVYSLDEARTLQCFCSVEGNGIQTNWWKISSIDQEQIEQLKKLGWQFVPSGKPWGLSDTSYLAMNSTFSCPTGSNGNSTTSTSSSNSGQVSSSAASTSSTSSPSVLGLAATGDTRDIVLLTSLSSISMVLGLISRKRSK